MRTVRRGMVAAALALPLALGAAGVAAADEKGGDFNAQYAAYDANSAMAGPEGAVANNVSSEAAGVSFEKDKDRDKDRDKGKDGDKGKGKSAPEAEDAAAEDAAAEDAAADPSMRSDDARHGKDKDKDKDRDKGKHKHGDKEAGWASYDENGAAAGPDGAASWDIESSAAYLDKD